MLELKDILIKKEEKKKEENEYFPASDLEDQEKLILQKKLILLNSLGRKIKHFKFENKKELLNRLDEELEDLLLYLEELYFVNKNKEIKRSPVRIKEKDLSEVFLNYDLRKINEYTFFAKKNLSDLYIKSYNFQQKIKLLKEELVDLINN